ncbi:MAG: DUF2157 domain-containing protein [Anaerolineae bacterium]|nr:DUF2157 domain-containing protein [Gloeobacterales cyanobacterium ES-bin-313]
MMDNNPRSQPLDFRRRLKQEASFWQENGILNASQLARLSELYGFDTLPTSNPRNLVGSIVTFGMLLVGLGVLTFVAANWLLIPSALQVVLLLAALWGAYGGGYYLWKVTGTSSVLGQGLILLGSLIYGGNIALFGQIFHADGELYQLCMLWTIGVLAVAYALGSFPSGVLALIVAGIGYLDWANTNYLQRSDFLAQLLPWGGLLLFLPLAYRMGSRWMFEIVCLAFAGFVLGNSFFGFNFFSHDTYLPYLVLMFLLALWSWVAVGFVPQSWQWPQYSPLRNLTALGIGLLCYLYSFWAAAGDLVQESLRQSNWLTFWSSPTVILLLLTSGLGLFWLWRQGELEKGKQVLVIIAAGSGGILATILLHPPVLAIVLLFNVLLIALAAYWIANGLQQVSRRDFLVGQGLLAMLILSRFFEYDTGLLVKAAAFIIAGGLLIYFALWFEKYLDRQGTVDNA